MTEWRFIAVLHNLSIRNPIENEYLAIAPQHDPRVQNLLDRVLIARYLAKGFTDQFNRPKNPSILIAREDFPADKLDIEAITSFRNSIALCLIVQAWQEYLWSGWQRPVEKYSNYFDLYPITLSRDNNVLVTSSPSEFRIDVNPKEFAGQTSPELAMSSLEDIFYDAILLSEIFKEWEGHFIERCRASRPRGKREEQKARALFRSLEMAYQASAIPFKNHSTIYDYGSSLALWVSAFEILVSPQAKLKKVLEHLGNVPLNCSRHIKYKYYKVRFSGKQHSVNLLQKVYHDIHRARNNFLHGNEVRFKDLFAFNKTRRPPLTFVAPVLYKVALMNFLGVSYRQTDLSTAPMQDYRNLRGLEEALLAPLKDREDDQWRL